MGNGPFSYNKWLKLFNNYELFLGGIKNTLIVALGGLILAFIIGLIIGLILFYKVKIVQKLCKMYISIIQNTPLVIQIFVFYSVLPRIGITLGTMEIGIIALALHSGTYIANIIYSALNSIPKGQLEAAYSQGFNFLQSMHYIILPQAIKIALPPTTNQLVSLIKDSSLMAVIAGNDLMNVVNSFVSKTLVYGPTFVVTALVYLVLCLPLSILSRWLERRSIKYEQ